MEIRESEKCKTEPVGFFRKSFIVKGEGVEPRKVFVFMMMIVIITIIIHDHSDHHLLCS